jgi:hypothetical protein
MDKNKNFYDWNKVKQLANYLKYNSNDVYNIIKNYYYHKHPAYLTFIALGLIKKNLTKIKLEVSIKPEINKNLKKINVVKKEKIEKSPFILNVPTKNHSRLVYWCNPFEPINKGKLGTTQGWRKEEKFPQYY